MSLKKQKSLKKSLSISHILIHTQKCTHSNTYCYAFTFKISILKFSFTNICKLPLIYRLGTSKFKGENNIKFKLLKMSGYQKH